MRIQRRLNPAGQDGFTLIECLVAATLLVVGLLGTFAMVDQANSADGASSTREAATNLGREFLETVRGDAYASVTPTLLSTELQAMPGYQSGTGPVVIRRRNLDYTITANVVSIDDPKDGLAGSGDNQPDDLKRVTAQVSWTGRRAGTINLASMLSSSGAKVGLKMGSFTMTSPSSTTITTVSPAPPPATFSATATGATTIIFAVDGTDQPATAVTPAGNCTGTTCTKTFSWNYASLSDGVYRITARTVDGAGIEGPPMAINVTINANQRTKPCGVGSTGTSGAGCLPVEAGYNYLPNGGTTPIFELRWQANPERNVIGYAVETSGGTQVCALDAQGNVTSPSAQSPSNAPGIESYACIDTSPPAMSNTAASYNVYAIYANPLTGATTNGPVTTVSQAGGLPASTSYSTVNKTFGMDPVTAQPAGCTDNLTDGFIGTAPPTNSIYSAYGSNTVATTFNFCTPTMATLFPTATTVDVQGNVTIAVTGDMNANNSSNHCLVSWNATAGAGGASVFPAAPTATLDLDGGSARQEALNGTTSVGASPVNIPLPTRLALALKLTGTKCASSRIVYGGQKSGQVSPVVPAPGTLTASFRVGTGTPSTLFARPNPPTATSRLASGSDMQVKWTGSAGGNVAFYRIYRDGQTYADRYDTCDVGDLTSAGGCDNGNNTFTYTDQNTGGTAHTYWVTAVYGTGASLTATMAESTEVAVP